ncbi:piggyBac transposable element-derived protein 4-like [Stegodyphus dumicola]|uniref:piggyBac transposable element-derived protein 4-like n=1 Tax=Stegodyphus dumicola TaxID=202533 RepID=UPI0015A98659|nr:piggyBac transposable element-derived protein 4-like [Stegodyphus dumicola]
MPRGRGLSTQESETWYKLMENCYLCYNPGPEITVDEQLLPCKSRCRFMQYMANKPDKFGMKFLLATAVKSKYVLNGYPYLRKDEERPTNLQLGERLVLKLLQPHLNSGLNFASEKLADELSAKKTTVVGTMSLNKRESPPIAHDTSLARYSSFALKNGDKTLTIYGCKSKRNVMILSTMHSNVFVDDSIKKKPNTVPYYNSTKCGVDVADQMLRKYSTSSGSRRWPVYVFTTSLTLLHSMLGFYSKNPWAPLFPVENLFLHSWKNYELVHYDALQLLKYRHLNERMCISKLQGQNKTVVSCEGCQKPILVNVLLSLSSVHIVSCGNV